MFPASPALAGALFTTVPPGKVVMTELGNMERAGLGEKCCQCVHDIDGIMSGVIAYEMLCSMGKKSA